MFEGMTLLEIIKMVMPLLVLQLILVVVALTSLARSEDVRVLPKWAWVVVILLINTIGPIIFLTVGREKEV